MTVYMRQECSRNQEHGVKVAIQPCSRKQVLRSGRDQGSCPDSKSAVKFLELSTTFINMQTIPEVFHKLPGFCKYRIPCNQGSVSWPLPPSVTEHREVLSGYADIQPTRYVHCKCSIPRRIFSIAVAMAGHKQLNHRQRRIRLASCDLTDLIQYSNSRSTWLAQEAI